MLLKLNFLLNCFEIIFIIKPKQTLRVNPYQLSRFALSAFNYRGVQFTHKLTLHGLLSVKHMPLVSSFPHLPHPSPYLSYTQLQRESGRGRHAWKIQRWKRWESCKERGFYESTSLSLFLSLSLPNGCERCKCAFQFCLIPLCAFILKGSFYIYWKHSLKLFNTPYQFFLVIIVDKNIIKLKHHFCT